MKDQAEKLRQKLKQQQKHAHLLHLLVFSDESLLSILECFAAHFNRENKKCCVFVLNKEKTLDVSNLLHQHALQVVYLPFSDTIRQEEHVKGLLLEEQTCYLLISFYNSSSQSLSYSQHATPLVVGVPDSDQSVLQAYSAIKFMQQSKLVASYSIVGLKNNENSSFSIQSVVNTAKKFLHLEVHNLGDFYVHKLADDTFVNQMIQQSTKIPQTNIWQLLQVWREDSDEKN